MKGNQRVYLYFKVLWSLALRSMSLSNCLGQNPTKIGGVRSIGQAYTRNLPLCCFAKPVEETIILPKAATMKLFQLPFFLFTTFSFSYRILRTPYTVIISLFGYIYIKYSVYYVAFIVHLEL
jgi:hypothetical protein